MDESSATALPSSKSLLTDLLLFPIRLTESARKPLTTFPETITELFPCSSPQADGEGQNFVSPSFQDEGNRNVRVYFIYNLSMPFPQLVLIFNLISLLHRNTHQHALKVSTTIIMY
jgi:hypothetical protein